MLILQDFIPEAIAIEKCCMNKGAVLNGYRDKVI
jgi:hypothetical protein